jgi:D-aspartate ligase
VARRLRSPAPGDAPAYLPFVLEQVHRVPYDVVFAVGEDPTTFLAQHQEAIRPHARVPFPPPDRFALCRDKSLTMREARRLGIATPRTHDPATEPLDAFTQRVGFPVVVKPNVSDGARGISYPAGAAALEQALVTTRKHYGPCHVQEYIPQTGTQYKAEVLLDDASRVRAWCVYSKLRYYPPSGGSSTLNRTVDRPDILDAAARMLRGIGWTGLGDCDFIEDPRDGVPKLMEINPRFTRSIRICVRAGVDFPLLLYRLAVGTGEVPASPGPYRFGVMQRYLPADVAWFLRSPDRFRTRPGFFATFFSGAADEVFSFADPGPALAYLLGAATDLLDPAARRYRLRP